jgi:hypothetical protein
MYMNIEILILTNLSACFVEFRDVWKGSDTLSGPFLDLSIKASQVTEELIDLDKHMGKANEWGKHQFLLR